LHTHQKQKQRETKTESDTESNRNRRFERQTPNAKSNYEAKPATRNPQPATDCLQLKITAQLPKGDPQHATRNGLFATQDNRTITKGRPATRNPQLPFRNSRLPYTYQAPAPQPLCPAFLLTEKILSLHGF
jgi:hypothetical protein